MRKITQMVPTICCLIDEHVQRYPLYYTIELLISFAYGFEFVVFLKDEHTLSLSVPGQPDYELTPYKGNEFLAKGRSVLSAEFECDASGVVTGIAATMPYGLFRGLKKA